jgi:hypothetical protein
MSERRPAQTIGELDIHLSNLQSRITELVAAQQQMANNVASKSDIEGLRHSMSALATKAELAAEIKAIRDEVDRIKPGNLLRQFTAILAALGAFGAVAALLLSIGGWVAQVPQQPAHQTHGATK